MFGNSGFKDVLILAVSLQVPAGDVVARGLAARAVLARVGPLDLTIHEDHVVLGKPRVGAGGELAEQAVAEGVLHEALLGVAGPAKRHHDGVDVCARRAGQGQLRRGLVEQLGSSIFLLVRSRLKNGQEILNDGRKHP